MNRKLVVLVIVFVAFLFAGCNKNISAQSRGGTGSAEAPGAVFAA
jgi:hypothetical protein